MLIRNEFEVAQPVEKVWQFFDNIPQVAACLPGAELTEDLGDDKYEGRVAVRMGPVRLQFAGTAEITERDEAAKRIVVHACGAEEQRPRPGQHGRHRDADPAGRGTKVAVAQDLQLSGAAAQYGRGMISDVTAVLMRDFSANLHAPDRAPGTGRVAGRDRRRGRTPAGGLTLGLRAAHDGADPGVPPVLPAVPARELRRGQAMVLWWIGNVDPAGRDPARGHLPAQPGACRARADPGSHRRRSWPAASPWSASSTACPRRWPRPTPPSRKSPSARSGTRAPSRSFSAKERNRPCQLPPGSH